LQDESLSRWERLQRERERERERGHTETVLALVKAGADVQLEFVQGATPLFVCDM